MMERQFRIRTYDFSPKVVKNLAMTDKKEKNWPVVYQICNGDSIYIGETTNLKNRMGQHLANSAKKELRDGKVSVIFDEKFNKSAALDLESFLIQYFSGDGKFKVINRNDGMLDRDYYGRQNYRETFEHIWEALRRLHIADRSISDINNSELFKFSPYKNLNFNQLEVVTDVLMNIDESFANQTRSLSIIGGDAGTGKTIVIMYLVKLLADLQTFDNWSDDIDDESNFGVFFEQGQINNRFKKRRIALIVPQAALCDRIRQIFGRVGLGDADVKIFSPLQFAESEGVFDITLVDEAHLLKIGIAHATLNRRVKDVNYKLFGKAEGHTELDWIMSKSQNVVMVYSEEQRVRQINVTNEDIATYKDKFMTRKYYLRQQMRSLGGESYMDYINRIFSKDDQPPCKETFPDFEAKLYRDFNNMVNDIRESERKFGLSRLVAGFSWEWLTKKGESDYDIEIEGVKLRWNKTGKMPSGSEASEVVGSIYTIQGEDLNYAGVIIGRDLCYKNGHMCFDARYYYDSGAKVRNAHQLEQGAEITEDDLLDQILRIYRVLMSRAVKGVYIYACDDGLREYLSRFFDTAA